MPLFFYNAVSNNGQKINSSKESRDASELARVLREEGLILISAKEADQKINKPSWFRALSSVSFFKIPRVEKIMFTEHLAVMIGAGLSLTRALEALSQQTKNKKFSLIIKDITENIRKGNQLADSLSKYPKTFSELYVNMIKVGEAGGNLEEVLRVLADQLKKEHELGSRVKGAMIYPAVILLAMFGIGVLMMIVVVPKLSAIFKELGTELPFSTQIIIWISDNLSNYWFFFLAFLIIAVVLFKFFLKSPGGKKIFDSLILKMPIFGEIIKKINSARMARTLSSMIKSGLPIVQGLQIVAGTLSNSLFRESLRFAATEIQKGQTLSLGIKKFPQIYPPMVSQMIEVGEETGTIDVILGKLAEFYEEEVTNITKGMTSIIEPVLMIIIGAAVGFFAISMLQPMYSMMNTIK